MVYGSNTLKLETNYAEHAIFLRQLILPKMVCVLTHQHVWYPPIDDIIQRVPRHNTAPVNTVGIHRFHVQKQW
jgi:hypothetical protein